MFKVQQEAGKGGLPVQFTSKRPRIAFGTLTSCRNAVVGVEPKKPVLIGPPSEPSSEIRGELP
jgi:hypothetical protein